MKSKWFNVYAILLISCFTGNYYVSGSTIPDQPEIDSLILASTKASTPKDKICTLFELSKTYKDASELNLALATNARLLEIISKHGTKSDSAKYFRLTGLIYLQMAGYDKSLENFMKSQQLYAETGDTILQARALMNIGIVHDNLGNKPMSLSYYNKALNYFKLINDEGGMADCELNIAIILTQQNEYEKACENLISAAGIYEKTGNKSNLAAAYINLGLTYKKLGNYPLAIDYLSRANEIWEQSGDDYHICYYHLNMGEIMLELKKPDQARNHLVKAEKLAIKSESKRLEALSYEFLSDYNSSVKNYKSAYTYLVKSKLINDSILNAKTTEKVNQIQYHYEIAKRETENEKLVKQNLHKELQLSKQNMFLYILSAVLLFIAIFAISLVRQNRIRKKINRQLAAQYNLIESQKDELVQLNASKDKFLSILAHDIRNPLSSIYGISHILVEDFSTLTEGEKRVFTKDIHTLSENLFEIINTLLTWSTSQSGLITYRPKAFSFAELCNRSIGTLQTVAKQKEITLVNHADESLMVMADENMIYSVLQNLLNNAIKFSFPDSEVRIETQHVDGHASISVIDSGIGLSAESKARLFQYDQHYLSRGTAGEAGTGLGLILCKDFVEKNGGTIWVESELSKGSIFIFTIPVAEV
jgi:signal transduction histidine kinase